MIKTLSRRNLILLTFIFLVGFFVRVLMISSLPPSLNWDETSLGYNAYSILKTGKDEWGVTMPLIFRAFGDYKLPGYIYTLVPFISVFGLTELAVRLPSVLAGSALILVTFFITLKTSKSLRASFLSASFVAFSPWTVFLSRVALEANLALFIGSLGFLILLLENKKWFLWGMVLLTLAAFTYNSARIVSPLLIVAFTLYYWHKKLITKKILLIEVAVLGFMWLPLFQQLVSGTGGARYNAVKIIDQGALNQLNELRGNSKLPFLITKIIYNKPVYFVQEFLKNYLSYLNPDFLFLEGGTQYQFSIPNFPLVTTLALPLFLAGLYTSIKSLRKNTSYIFLIVLFLISIVPGSITRDAPHVLRSIFMITPVLIFIAIGAEFINTKLLKTKKLILIFTSLVALSLAFGFVSFWMNYTDYGKTYSESWQYGYKEAINYVNENKNSYDNIIISKKYGEPHIFYLWYSQIDPSSYQNSNSLIRFHQSDWYWVDKFKNIFFVNDWQVPHENSLFTLESKSQEVDCAKSHCLLVTSEENFPKGWKKLKTINFLDGKIAFEIYEN